MVRKISGDKPASSGASAIQGPRSIESAKVGEVEQVRQTQRQAGVGPIRRSTRQLTPEERQELLAMIDQEAEAMFSETGLPESKKETLKGAVRMAIEATFVEDDDKS